MLTKAEWISILCGIVLGTTVAVVLTTVLLRWPNHPDCKDKIVQMTFPDGTRFLCVPEKFYGKEKQPHRKQFWGRPHNDRRVVQANWPDRSTGPGDEGNRLHP